jgi:UDP-glucose 4-epimerase
MKTVLITGVTGFIGRQVAHQFATQGWGVVGMGTRPPENAPRQDLRHYYQLVLPSEHLDAIIKQTNPQVCIHCAGRASVGLSFDDPAADFNTGVELTFGLLNALRLQARSCRTIFLSSAAVYGNPKILPIQENHETRPISPYGFHKLICEELLREFNQVYGLPTVAVRIFSAYGVGLRRQVLWDLCQKAFTQPALLLRGTGNESRDFIHGRDVARAIYLLAERAPCEGEVFNLASGIETRIKELVELIVAQIGKEITVAFDGNNPLGNPLNWQADISRLAALGYTPVTSLEDGVKIYTDWCRMEVLGQ